MGQPNLDSDAITPEFQEEVDRYFKGSMTEQEAHTFWEGLLKDGEKMDYFTMEGYVRILHKKRKEK